MTRAILFDLDGVLLRNRAVARLTEEQVTRFVQRRLRTPTLLEAQNINRVMYTGFGHTLIGLQKVYGVRDSVQEFNHAIYTPEFFQAVSGALVRDAETRACIRDARAALRHCRDRGVEPFVFTNAPSIWANHALRVLGACNLVNENNQFTSDHMVSTEGQLLKPDPRLYERVRAVLCERGFGARTAFVDDSLTNLKPLIGDRSWDLFWLSASGYVDGSNLRTIRELSELGKKL
jgi:FMN phosphatase YigB (HAD superfamily)